MAFVAIGVILVVISLSTLLVLRARPVRRFVRRSRRGGRRPQIIPVQAGQTLAETGKHEDHQ